MNDKELQSLVLNEKRKQYENKILEFMGKTQQSHATSLNIQQPTPAKPQPSQRQTKQFSHNSSTNRSKTLKRTTTNQPHTEQQTLPHNHKHLLQKIQSRIHQMNTKISEEISHQENSILDQYAQNLKSKQEELNRLRSVTNEEMIHEKTVERKEQLMREKENLIEGNHYYNHKLEQLKKEFNRLAEIRDFARKSLKVMTLDQSVSLTRINPSKDDPHSRQSSRIPSLETSHMQASQLSKRSKHKPVYFSSQDYVEKVLQKYNQKSRIISESRLQESIDSHQQVETNRKHESLLPCIVQKRQQLSKSKSINPEYGEEDFYSYRRVKKNFDRAKSTGVFDSLGMSVDSRVESIDNLGERMGKKIGKIDWNNSKNFKLLKTNQKSAIQTKGVSQKLPNSDEKQPNQKPISQTSQIPTIHSIPNDKLQYTKEYLQQFVVKKTSKQQPKAIVKPKLHNRQEELAEKEQLIKEQLEPQLKIEGLFRSAAEEYYKYKHRYSRQMHARGEKQVTEQSIENEEQQERQQAQQEIPLAKGLTTSQKQQAVSSLELKQFDKKLIMDLLLNQYSFKQYLYDLISSEFEPKSQNPLEMDLQQVIHNFDNSKIYSDHRNP